VRKEPFEKELLVDIMGLCARPLLTEKRKRKGGLCLFHGVTGGKSGGRRKDIYKGEGLQDEGKKAGKK